MLEIGIRGESSEIVTTEKTASAVHSGNLLVYATPAMIALMEKTAYESIAPYLEEGQSSVGTLLHIGHIAATPVGMQVKAKSKLIEIDGRRLVFEVEAFDEKEKIGDGLHERFLILKDRFQEKVNAKTK